MIRHFHAIYLVLDAFSAFVHHQTIWYQKNMCLLASKCALGISTIVLILLYLTSLYALVKKKQEKSIHAQIM